MRAWPGASWTSRGTRAWRGEDLTVTSFGGYKDYCVETLGIPAFTIETGASAWGIPVPIERFPEIYAQCKNLTALAAAP